MAQEVRDPRDDAQAASLARLALALQGALDAEQIFGRLAGVLRNAVPFDRLLAALPDRDGSTRLFTASPEKALEGGRDVARTAFSSALWPEDGRGAVLPGLDGLDRSCAVDAELIDFGTASIARAPIPLADGASAGLLLLASRAGEPYRDTHGRLLEAAGELCAVAVAQERLTRAERERRRRHDALEALLPPLASALDVREVFEQLSQVARQVLPHELIALGLLAEDGRSVRIYGVSEEMAPVEREFPVPEDMRSTLEADHFILHDIVLEDGPPRLRGRIVPTPETGDGWFELPIDPFRLQLFRSKGIRSQIRVPVRLGAAVAGMLIFNTREERAYRLDDVDVARRIADHVALAVSHQRLADQGRRAAEARERAGQLEARVARLTRELEESSPHKVFGASKKWKATLADASRVAGTDTTVLLTGESGTGKEVVARFVHRGSRRAEGPFVALNCAALPDQLLESELFGYEKGAFTGAVSAKPGRLEQAAAGTLFLDEVGETTPLVQAKLLRVLQEREFQRLGSTRVQKADVRVIAATNRDLKAAIGKGTFREDLYYRLHVFEIRLPPLRERTEDILPLTEAFLAEIGAAVGRPAAGLAKDARDLMLSYPWPGNVRELKNALERAVILCEGGLVTSEHLPIGMRDEPAPGPPAAEAFPKGGVDLEAMERAFVEKALAAAGHNKAKAARLLGLTRAQLYSRLEKYGLGEPTA
jgi:transcriptional regulator with GAF, ATPase, and Fis domain